MNNIIKRDLQKVVGSDFIDYAMSVIMQRALPDARDGFKPVHRRVLYAMNELKMKYNIPYKKSARVVGDVIGKYHPHGDSSVYNAMVRMSQDFSMRYPLVDGHGNFGSIDGDSAAAMRYTEVRPTWLGQMMLEELKEDTVDFQPNFSDDEQEPVILPAVVPNLLLNGSKGIAVGMATSIPPHNITELMAAVDLYVDTDGKCDIEELIEEINMPDFPTGGTIYDKEEIVKGYRTGKGAVRMVGKTVVAKNGRAIDVVELPYKTNIVGFIEKVADIVKAKSGPGITGIEDHSDREGMCIRIHLKAGADPQAAIDYLYAKTQLKGSYGMNLVAINEGKPETMNLKQIIAVFVEHRVQIIRRKTKNALTKAKARKLIVDGLIVALDDIDKVVDIVKTSVNKSEARERLMKKYDLLEVQANAILDMKLSRLTSLSNAELAQEKEDLIKKIVDLEDILDNRSRVLGIIKAKNTEIISKCGDERRTNYIPIEMKKLTKKEKERPTIVEKDVVVVYTADGLIKSVDPKSIKTQNRNTKGVKSETVIASYSCKTTDSILAFSDTGKAHKIVVDDIPFVDKKKKGSPINTLVGATVHAVCLLDENAKDVFVFTTSKVKRTKIEEFKSMKRDSINAIKLDPQDRIVDIVFADDSDTLITASKTHTTKFEAKEIKPTGRTAKGVKSMDCEEVMFAGVENGESKNVVFAFSNGNGIKVPLDDIKKIKRGGKGNLVTKDQEIAGMIVCKEDTTLIISGEHTVVNIKSDSIAEGKRGNKGLKLIKSAIKNITAL